MKLMRKKKKKERKEKEFEISEHLKKTVYQMEQKKSLEDMKR